MPKTPFNVNYSLILASHVWKRNIFFHFNKRTIYKDVELKGYLEQAGFHDVQIHKKKSWLCITAWK